MTGALKGEFGKSYVSDYIFDEAVTIAHIRTGNKDFSFTDCTNIAFMERHDIDTLFTYDSEFEGIVSVIG